MRYALAVLVTVVGCGGGYGQTQLDLRTQSRNVDFSSAPSTKPVKMGATLPATCSAGEMFFKTTGENGKNLYGCVAANQWELMSGAAISSGCGLIGCETGQCGIDSAIVPSYATPLTANGVVVGRGGSMLGALAPGAAGHVLTSAGTGTDPVWAAPGDNHAALTNLDYGNSGHTGFQAALGYTPERQLEFTAPLERAGNVVSCPTCSTESAGPRSYTMEITLETTVTIPGTEHGLSSADIGVTVLDDSPWRRHVEADSWMVDPVTRDVVVTFAAPQSGRVILR